ncbi:hypothetical protein MPER_07666 [Moniliophthora perniciosa FA553]|nr:hypothetical protein MPER_07666 [Moniliophthora perniciosa FA553]
MVVQVYDSIVIAEKLGLTRPRLILYALVVGNDFNKGVPGCGPEIGLALARSGVGDSILQQYQQLSRDPNGLLDYLETLKRGIIQELRTNAHGKLTKCRPKLARSLEESTDFPSCWLQVLEFFINPPTSWSHSRSTPPTFHKWTPQLPDIQLLATESRRLIGWGTKRVLSKFREHVWTGLVLRMLCSPNTHFRQSTGEFFAPIRVPHPEEFVSTWQIALLSSNPPKIRRNDLLALIRPRFSMSNCIQVVGNALNAPAGVINMQNHNLEVYIPALVVAIATNQIIAAEAAKLLKVPARSFGLVLDLTFDDNGDGMDISEVTVPDSNTGSSVMVLDSTSDNDDDNEMREVEICLTGSERSNCSSPSMALEDSEDIIFGEPFYSGRRFEYVQGDADSDFEMSEPFSSTKRELGS